MFTKIVIFFVFHAISMSCFTWFTRSSSSTLAKLEFNYSNSGPIPHNVYMTNAFRVDAIIEKSRPFFPNDTKFNFFLNSELDRSVIEISEMLKKEGLPASLFDAYSNLGKPLDYPLGLINIPSYFDFTFRRILHTYLITYVSYSISDFCVRFLKR